MHDVQTEMSLERIEITIAVQQHESVHKAARRNQGIHCPANGYAKRS